MKKGEAVVLIMAKYPNHIIDKVTETEKHFLVSIYHKKYKNSEGIRPKIVDDGLKAVDKKTKEIFTYNPIRDDR